MVTGEDSKMVNDNEFGEWNPYEDALDTYDQSVGARDAGDIEQAQRLLEISVHMGWHEAQYDLAIKLLTDGTTSEESKQRAIDLLKSAAMFNARARQKLQEITGESED
jgi:hypothetical protein